jgi:hypothetical protein
LGESNIHIKCGFIHLHADTKRGASHPYTNWRFYLASYCLSHPVHHSCCHNIYNRYKDARCYSHFFRHCNRYAVTNADAICFALAILDCSCFPVPLLVVVCPCVSERHLYGVYVAIREQLAQLQQNGKHH